MWHHVELFYTIVMRGLALSTVCGDGSCVGGFGSGGGGSYQAGLFSSRRNLSDQNHHNIGTCYIIWTLYNANFIQVP